jgi:hypothetical protein
VERPDEEDVERPDEEDVERPDEQVVVLHQLEAEVVL